MVQQHFKNMVGNNAPGGALGESWEVLGRLGERFGRPKGILDASWVRLGGVRWRFGGTIGRLEGILALSWGYLGARWGG